jgi:hypothetical protein
MRFLSTLFLSLCCLAASLQSNAVDTPVKQPKAAGEYNTAATATPTDALKDYYHITATGNAVTNISLQKEVSYYLTSNADKNISSYILNDSFQNIRLLIGGNYAKTFRTKLIFPQHYHW